MIKKTKNKQMKTREQKIKERRDEVILKLNISPEVVALYDMYIDDSGTLGQDSLNINDKNNSICIDISDSLEVRETGLSYEFYSYRNNEIVALVSIGIKTKMTRVRLW